MAAVEALSDDDIANRRILRSDFDEALLLAAGQGPARRVSRGAAHLLRQGDGVPARHRATAAGAVGGLGSVERVPEGRRTARADHGRSSATACWSYSRVHRWRAALTRRRHRSPSLPTLESSVTSNVGQNYPYTSETEADRAATDRRARRGAGGLSDTLKAETTPLDANERWWVWKCPTPAAPAPPRRGLRGREARALRRLRRDLRQDVPALSSTPGAAPGRPTRATSGPPGAGSSSTASGSSSAPPGSASSSA